MSSPPRTTRASTSSSQDHRHEPRAHPASAASSSTRATRCWATAAAACAITYPEILDMQVTAIIEAPLKWPRPACKVLPGNHDSADHRQEGAARFRSIRPGRWPTAMIKKAGIQGQVHGGHDDRDAPRRPAGRQDRRGGRVLLLRHERSDADDAGPFARRCRPVPARYYVASEKDGGKGIFKADPFQSLDQKALASSVKMGIEKGRSTRKDLKVGICGEHGGESPVASSSATPRA